jgi:hypothetical protein
MQAVTEAPVIFRELESLGASGQCRANGRQGERKCTFEEPAQLMGMPLWVTETGSTRIGGMVAN